MYSFFTSESCMASAALSTRFTTTLWNCSRSRFTGGNPGAKLVAMSMPSRRPWKTASAPRHHLVQIAAHRLRGGEARELRELVHQRLHRFHRREMVLGALAQDAAFSGGRSSAPVWRLDALGRKRDGGERILDFVRHAAGHLVPGGGLSARAAIRWCLRAPPRNPRSASLRAPSHRDGQMQLAALGAHLQSGATPRRCGARASSGT
jgi:hypothetical protein